jgi:hypothetical protein
MATPNVGGITAESAENLADIEKQWAVKAYEHAETYFKLLQEIDPKTLKLTRYNVTLILSPSLFLQFLTPHFT